MIYVIMNDDVHRHQAGRTWQSKAAIFATTTTLSGVTMGLGLGSVGALLTSSTRAGIATLLALVGIVVGCVELSGRRIRVLQWDRETEQRWMHSGAWTSAALNGLTLGSGFSSRLGYWLWYAVPGGSFLCGQPLIAAAVYGSYGLVRGIIPVMLSSLLSAGSQREESTRNLRSIQASVVRRASLARLVANWQLTSIGVAVLVAVGR